MNPSLTVTTVPISLATLDALVVDVLVLPLFADERPLKGTAGFCDWRMNGRLSGLLQNSMFRCQANEVLLTNTQGSIGTERVLLFGQGKRGAMNHGSYEVSITHIVEVLKKAHLERFALELPGVEPGPVSVPQAISAFLEAAASAFSRAQASIMSPYPRFAELVAEIATDDRRIAVSSTGGHQKSES